MDLLTRIIEDAICVEPTKCDNCSCLSEWGHVGDSGWRCVSCCITRPEWAVETLNVAGLAVAFIGAKPLGSLGVPYLSREVDAAVARLLDEVVA